MVDRTKVEDVFQALARVVYPHPKKTQIQETETQSHPRVAQFPESVAFTTQ